jgi:hypothetical protein
LSLSLQIIPTPRQLSFPPTWPAAATTTLPPRSDDASHELFIFSTSRQRTTTSPPRSDDALPVEPEREAASEVGEHERLGERCAHHVHQRRRRHEQEVHRRKISRRCGPGAALPSSCLYAPPRGCLILSLLLLLLQTTRYQVSRVPGIRDAWYLVPGTP